MNPINSNPDREAKAVAALIAASLHQEKTPVDSALVAKYLRGEFTLTEEEARALARAKLDFGPSTPEVTQGPLVEFGLAGSVAALHRQKPQSGFSQQTEEELERKRRELQEKLRRRRQSPPP
jgi:hypothetical protein